ncbi:MAG TPA: SpoIIIAH-like family protein [Candidatus Fimiplasma intestinipullorum]|uniref:SpoIIIAH-like family protein n=1 Tax=Candidatus Fimiplasma intestinipullorum TaxID=2840825 RepID=A0A9D1HP82_9FIRM|nr:SpoIIIAH-like family protein [Candidatus Fimiplasma intestinipullorum]
MNKQAITFLSLFSLILVLSVYYIMLPPASSLDQDITVSEKESETYDVAKMQEELDAKREEEVADSNAIISSASSTQSEVTEALEEIEQTKEARDLENQITTMLKDEGYANCFVELSQESVKITIHQAEGSSEDAAKIISLVMEKTDGKYVPEVKFVSE